MRTPAQRPPLPVRSVLDHNRRYQKDVKQCLARERQMHFLMREALPTQ